MTRQDQPKAPPEIERVAKSLVTVDKAVTLYPKTSAIPRSAATECARLISETLKERSELRFAVEKEGLFFEGALVAPGLAAIQRFARELYNHRLSEVRFHVGVDARSIVGFVALVRTPAPEVEAAGGFEARLWDLNITTISVTQTTVSIVEVSAVDDEVAAAETMDAEELDAAVLAAYGGSTREQLIVARVLADPRAATRYLTDALGDMGTSGLRRCGERFAMLAEIARRAASGQERLELLGSLGRALTQLDARTSAALLADEVLPEARTDQALAAVVRHLGVDEICDLLVAGLGGGQEAVSGLARALRNLSVICAAEQADVINAAGVAMRNAGFGQQRVTDVFERAFPSRVAVAEPRRPAGPVERPIDAVLKLMELAPGAASGTGSDPEIDRVRAEARNGISDGDVIMALVTLVGLDPRPTQFATVMSMLEDALDVLVERGEIDLAADAADALLATARDERLDEGQRTRVRQAIKRFTKPEDMQAMAHALRVYPEGSPEHTAARRLLEALGAFAIAPLLEQIAAEQDMAVRKQLVDALSEMAVRHVREVGEHVVDPRWYVVRNVVGALARTRSSAILPYLERVVRHPEPRVRREVIRALSNVHDRRAHELLISALDDDDAQNVSLAARFLGVANIRSAVPALIRVARGEGRGNREPGPRVEAIEALGRMGAREALPALESLARSRIIVGAGRIREVRAAAEAAAARIRAVEGGAI